MQQACRVASKNEEKAKTEMKKRYDQGTKPQVFQVGDLVLILEPTNTIKLLAKWHEPFTIVQALSETTYKVQRLNTNERSHTYHTNFLKRYNSPSAVCLIAEADWTEDMPTWEPARDGEKVRK